ncbi:MAG: bifunctional demethylmenaquinone methyltransferase/2-methoxy-6-polyprenyl-1,4-benzoquinol methylase UbiE [Pseudomonadota bacterium]
METETERTTHFGAETIPEAEKAGRVRGVFSSVAARYDLMNDIMSGGVHRLWKDQMVAWLAPRPGWRVLDVAGGTGDIAFRIHRAMTRLGQRGGQFEGEITVLDLTQEMLVEGERRAQTQGLQGIDWVCGDAMALPFPDRSFDAFTIAFGIRNVTRPEDALAEAYRVLKPGGRFLCLEFSRVTPPALRAAYDAYSYGVIPRMGQAVTGDRDSYQYLVESIRRFPDQHRFEAMVHAAGFGRVSHRNLTLGVAAMHSGWRL